MFLANRESQGVLSTGVIVDNAFWWSIYLHLFGISVFVWCFLRISTIILSFTASEARYLFLKYLILIGTSNIQEWHAFSCTFCCTVMLQILKFKFPARTLIQSFSMGLCFQVKLSDYIGKKYVILFFYPLDFTFVCPTGKFTYLVQLITSFA